MTIESRPSFPYVSRLRIVKYPSMSLVNAGTNQQGQNLVQRHSSQPSIQVEITTYIGDEKAFVSEYSFASRVFLQTVLDELKAISTPTTEIESTILSITARLITEKLWLEDVLDAAGIPALEGLWSDAFSDTLDTFTKWAESTKPIGGIPVYIRQLEWDACLPLDAAKSVVVTMGLYPTAACDSEYPVRKVLQFEDGATKRNRDAQIAHLRTLIADREIVIKAIDEIIAWKAMPLSAERSAKLATYNQAIVEQADLASYKIQRQQELTGYSEQIARLEAVDYGTILSLLSSPSVASSVKNLIIVTIGTLKKHVPEWSALDMDIVEQRFFVPDVA